MRIAMIAMSGVRAVDPELLAVGLTLPGIVARSKVIVALPSLGLLTLAGMTPERHTVDYREADTPEDVDAVAPAALGHRILLNFEGQAEGVSAYDIVADLIKTIKKRA